ncbi:MULTISPECIES: hypothetical protein [unclassified Microcoleus]|uniref:hypothetical protein n=1 Tax=unclassified Microcoleus TaxID=2642155 RepID=UPI0025DC2BE4|nr:MULTISPECIES: hypothetical protein [unclassified Microcoleus]
MSLVTGNWELGIGNWKVEKILDIDRDRKNFISPARASLNQMPYPSSVCLGASENPNH